MSDQPNIHEFPMSGDVIAAGKASEWSCTMTRHWKMTDISLAEGFSVEISVGPKDGTGERQSFAGDEEGLKALAARRILESESAKFTFTNTSQEDLEFAGEFAETPAPVASKGGLRKLSGTRVSEQPAQAAAPKPRAPVYPGAGQNGNGNGSRHLPGRHATGSDVMARLAAARQPEPEPDYDDAPHPDEGAAQVSVGFGGTVTFRPGTNEVVAIMPRSVCENLRRLSIQEYVPPWELQGITRYLDLALHPTAGKKVPQAGRPQQGARR